MVQRYDIREFLTCARANPVIDVRSPAEYEYGRIPGAHSMPLFDNEERAQVGTLYKQQGRKAAIKKGLELVGPRMRQMVEFAEGLPCKDTLLVHCWRGGMRSESVAWLLGTYGLPVATLNGGYKSFRSYVLSYFELPLKLIVLAGPTGSGKTELLQALERHGQQVLNLEGLANHKGSVFGELGQQPQPSSEHFQNLTFWKLKDFDLSRPIWLEDESIGIGRVMIPEALWKQMGRAPRLYFEMQKEIRIKRLVEEYGSFPNETLRTKILQLHKKLGGQHVNSILENLNKGYLEAVASQLLVYYDKAYGNAAARHKGNMLHAVEAGHEDFDAWAQRLIELSNIYDKPGKTYAI